VFAFVLGAILGNVAPLNPLPKKQPIIIHTVDNAGGVMVGQITDKEIVEGRYTVTAEAYGKFLITKEQYENLKVGDPIPEGPGVLRLRAHSTACLRYADG